MDLRSSQVQRLLGLRWIHPTTSQKTLSGHSPPEIQVAESFVPKKIL